MEKDKDVFRFEDFVDVDKLQKMKSNLIKEGIIGDADEDDFDDEEIDPSLNPYNVGGDGVDYKGVQDAMVQEYGDVSGMVEDFEQSDEYTGTTDTGQYVDEFSSYLNGLKSGESEEEYQSAERFDFNESNSDDEDDDFYKLYKDKAEEFTCDIAIEGVSQSDTEVRLIVEADEWTLMFTGEIRNGQCTIPMKKLSILNEGDKGTIRLEVNADGTLFTPWEDSFVVRASKKVTVKVNESRTSKSKKPAAKKAPGVSVKVRK